MNSYLFSTSNQIDLLLVDLRPLSTYRRTSYITYDYINLLDLSRMNETSEKFKKINSKFKELIKLNSFKDIQINWISSNFKYICFQYDHVFYFYELSDIEKHVSFDLVFDN